MSDQDRRPTHVVLALAIAAMVGGCGGPSGQAPASTGSSGPSAPSSTPEPSPASTASPDTGAIALGLADLDRPLKPGSYRVGDPFDVPFSIALPTEWTLMSLSEGDVSFLNTGVNAGVGAAWITIDRIKTVYDDPCHGRPIEPPVGSTVDGVVAALTGMTGFEPGPVSDVVLDGHAGKAVELWNSIDTQTAGCKDGLMLPMWTISGGGEAATNGGSRENLWVVEIDGGPLLIDGTMFIPATPEASRAEIEMVVQSLRFGSSAPAPVPSVAAAAAAQPGLVDIGGRSLFMECRGSGALTVVFLAGYKVSRVAMRGVEDGVLDESVRVCSYDRAGEGQSDPAPKEQTDLDVTDDLVALLAAAQIKPPYVLVGHSRGGDQAWLLADRHPDGVAGLMLMNAGFFELDWDTLGDVWSDAEIAEERAVSEAGLGSIKQAASPADGVRYVVMLSTIAQCASPGDVCGRIYPRYEAWARELAGRTDGGRFVSVEAGHEIYVSKPDRVIEELKRLVDDAR